MVRPLPPRHTDLVVVLNCLQPPGGGGKLPTSSADLAGKLKLAAFHRNEDISAGHANHLRGLGSPLSSATAGEGRDGRRDLEEYIIPLPENNVFAQESVGKVGAAGFIFQAPIPLCITALNVPLDQSQWVDGMTPTTQNVVLVFPANFPPSNSAPIQPGELQFFAADQPIDMAVATPGLGIDVPAGQLVGVAGDAGPEKDFVRIQDYTGDVSLLGPPVFPNQIAGYVVDLNLFKVLGDSSSSTLRDGPPPFYSASEAGIIGLVEVFFTVGECGTCTEKPCGKS